MQIKSQFSRGDCATVYSLVSQLILRSVLHLLISLAESENQIDFNFQAFWQGNSTSAVKDLVVNDKQELISWYEIFFYII